MSNSNQQKQTFWIILSVSILCGLTAGILGEVIFRTYVSDYSSSFSSEINLSNLNSNNSGLIIRDPKKVVVNQDVKIAETVSNIRPVLVSVFKEIATSSPTSAKNDYYDLSSPLFVGLVVTADGWVMALPNADLKHDFKFKNYVAIGSDRRLYHIDKLTSLKNLPADVLVFHLAGANNLPVKRMIPRSELTLGESLLVMPSGHMVWPTTLAAVLKTSAILSSDSLNVRLSLTDAGDEFANAFVFDLAGNLAAVISDDGEVVPAFSYDSAWSVLSGRSSLRPFLGVNYLDLSAVKSLDFNLDKGALIHASMEEAGVLKDSPAALAGLKAGDIITWVNNQEVDANNDLADLLSAYEPNDKITLTYLRAGVEKSVEAKLGELK